MGKGLMMNGASAKIAKKRGKKMQGMTSRSCSSNAPPLRPKVYITNVADFRRLVQELTSNCNSFPRFPSPGSLDATSTDNDTVSRTKGSRLSEDFEEVMGWQDTASGCFGMDMSSYSPQRIYGQQQKKMLNLEDIESWLLETDSVAPSWDNYVPEISIYDYITGDV